MAIISCKYCNGNGTIHEGYSRYDELGQPKAGQGHSYTCTNCKGTGSIDTNKGGAFGRSIGRGRGDQLGKGSGATNSRTPDIELLFGGAAFLFAWVGLEKTFSFAEFWHPILIAAVIGAFVGWQWRLVLALTGLGIAGFFAYLFLTGQI